MPSCAVLCCVVLRYVMLCCVVLCCVCVVLCCAALCYVCVAFCCDVLCRAVPKVLLPKGKGRDVYPRVQVNGRSVCVARALCASVFTTAESGGICSALCWRLRVLLRRPRLRCQGGGVQPSLRSVGGAARRALPPPSAHALLCSGPDFLCRSPALAGYPAAARHPAPSRASFCSLPHCPGAVGSGLPAAYCRTA